MKYVKKKKNRGLKTAIVVLSLLLAAMVGVIVFLQLGKPPAEAPQVTEAATEPQAGPADIQPDPFEETASPTEETVNDTDLMVSTPYCTLYYPAQWMQNIRTESETTAVGHIVTFYGTAGEEEAALFAVYFAEAGQNSYPVGFLTDGGTTLDVSVELFDFDPDSPAGEDLSAMQEGVNYLIDKLGENPAFSLVSPNSGLVAETQPQQEDTLQQTEEPVRDKVIRTPYCDLYYPAQWKDAVRYEGQETEVGYIGVFTGVINGRKAELFRVWFADADETCIPVGIYSTDAVTVDVCISLPELPEDNDWTQQEQELFYGLQETANYLLDRLKEEPGFTPLEP